jgi:hypothetical protein
VASNLLTSETLIHMADEEMFEAKFQWLLLRARGDDQTSRSFRHQLNLIKAARASGHFGWTSWGQRGCARKGGFDEQWLTDALRNYEPFQNFLKMLPLHELP